MSAVQVDDGHPDGHDMILPPQGVQQTLTCCSITPHFVVTGSQDGKLCYYLVESLHQVCSPLACIALSLC
jgi:hypothetical protein